MAKKAIVFIANGSEEIEALTPVDYLRRAGVEVTLVAVGGTFTSVSVDADDMMLVEGASCYVECSHGVTVVSDSEVSYYVGQWADSGGDRTGRLMSVLADVDAVIVPGGMPGAANIAKSSLACDIIREMNESEKLVCAICAAPAVVLPKTGALAGKAWTCYPGMESGAAAYAARYQSGAPFVHDANLITGRGPGAAEQWAMEIVRTLCGDAVAQKVHDGSMQR